MQRLAIEYLIHTKDRFSDKAAIVDADGHVTFAELWRRALSLAHHLGRAVDGRDVPIVIDLPKCVDAVVALVAVQLIGQIYVPFDPATPAARRRRMLDTLGEHHIIGRDESGLHVDGHSVDATATGDGMAEERVRAALNARNSIDPLYIIFTSGTTGTPKGVTISNASVIDYIDWAATTYRVSETEVIGNQAPLFFDNSVLDLYLTFAKGCTLHLIPPERFLFLPEMLDYLEEERVSLIFFVPSVFANIASLDLLAEYALPDLRKILFAGEPMPVNTLKYLRQRLPHALLSNLYGPTEITVDAIYWIFGEEIDSLRAVPLGVPCANTRIIFVDERGEPVPDGGAHAEICVAGAGVALGYWNDPQRTTEVFIQNPEHRRYHDIVYKTGDLGYRSADDGLIYMTGRKDNQIKHMGYRIELEDIEHALESLHGVTQSAVHYDTEHKELIAFYCSTNGAELSDPRRRLAEQLPPYMLPRRFHLLPAIPTTPNGKIDRRRIWQDYGGGA